MNTCCEELQVVIALRAITEISPTRIEGGCPIRNRDPPFLIGIEYADV